MKVTDLAHALSLLPAHLQDKLMDDVPFSLAAGTVFIADNFSSPIRVWTWDTTMREWKS